MKIRVCDIDETAAAKLPAATDDKSGVGVHYVDAFLKPLNVTLPDGSAIRCKRKGLKIVFAAGGKKGEALLRRLEHGPDPVAMLDVALREAAQAAGAELSVEAGAIYLTM